MSITARKGYARRGIGATFSALRKIFPFTLKHVENVEVKHNLQYEYIIIALLRL